MGFEDGLEKGTSSQRPSKVSKMTLQKAVDMGEYNPSYLATFPEWHSVSRHIQFQYIRTALENRRKHLLTQWADVSTILDFSKKPELASYVKKKAKLLNAPISKVVSFALVSQKKRDSLIKRKESLIKAYKQIAESCDSNEFMEFEKAQLELSKELD